MGGFSDAEEQSERMHYLHRMRELRDCEARLLVRPPPAPNSEVSEACVQCGDVLPEAWTNFCANCGTPRNGRK